MKRMHDKKSLGNASRHFIHFTAAERTYKYEFFDNHSARYTVNDMANVFAVGKAGIYESDAEGNGVSVCYTASTTQVKIYEFNTALSGNPIKSSIVSISSISHFIDEE